MNSKGGWASKKAGLIKSNNELVELDCFERDDETQADGSSYINWKNQLFVFGGETVSRQISQLIGVKGVVDKKITPYLN